MEDYISSIFFLSLARASKSLSGLLATILLRNVATVSLKLRFSLLSLSIVSCALRSLLTRNSMSVICLPFWLLHYYYTISSGKIQIELCFFYHQLGKMDFRFFNASLWVEPIPPTPIHIPLQSTRDAYTLIV